MTGAETACEICGYGLTPDERMKFEGRTISDILRATYEALTSAQLQIATAECCLAKIMELDEDSWRSQRLL